jgi:peptide methionine sulfoxide reductase msrA/msrB
MTSKPLSPAEHHVIACSGTEPPFSGALLYNHVAGTYHCRRCDAPLFSSDAKFDSGSGWPSFDDAIPDRVEERPDADGRRTEIVCRACGAHLGHVFSGEGFTPQNTRHCVNSLSLRFTAAGAGREAHAYFAGGCFWGVEHHFQSAPGVIAVRSGYMGGTTADPTYEEVCSGATGHAEVVEVRYDPDVTSFRALAELFFEIHDPSQEDRQGPDIGTQYRSAVFTSDEGEEEILADLMDQLRAQGLSVATRVAPMQPFYPAEPYHQRYYARTGRTPYCHVRAARQWRGARG